MIKSVARGEMEITPLFADEMNFCLDCQACETACPAGVKYGSMVEAARVEVTNAGYGSALGRLIKSIALKYILASKSNLKLVARLLYFYQNSGLQKIIHSSGILKLFSKNLQEIDSLSPVVSKKFSDGMIEEITPPLGKVKYKTAFLSGCLMNVMFAEINKDTVDVLSAVGCEVFTPKAQVCCGSLHAHNGDISTAKKLAKQTIDAFEKREYDILISNSAGCGAFMKEYAHIFRDDPLYAVKAKRFSAKIKDITEFINDLKEDLPFTDEVKESVTYHDACHLAHTQKITEPPRKVIGKIPGLDIKQLEESSWCCGSAGIYNVVRYEDSMKFLERKMKNIKNTDADVVLTGNPGCISQLRYGAKKFGVDVKIEHPVTLLKKSIKANHHSHK